MYFNTTKWYGEHFLKRFIGFLLTIPFACLIIIQNPE